MVFTPKKFYALTPPGDSGRFDDPYNEFFIISTNKLYLFVYVAFLFPSFGLY
jgi:hypothetical protein